VTFRLAGISAAECTKACEELALLFTAVPGLGGLRNAVRAVRLARGKRSRCVVVDRGGLLEIHRPVAGSAVVRPTRRAMKPH